MSTQSQIVPSHFVVSPLSIPCWFAVLTCARHEKQVAKQMEQRQVEHFLPLFESLRRWKDRKVSIAMPLFPGYLFVHIALKDRLQVLQIPGVAQLVGANGNPLSIPQHEIETLQKSLGTGVRVEPHPYLKVGRRVRVKHGALQGAEGILVRKKTGYRVILSIDLIMRSLAVEVDIADLEPIY